MLGDTEDRYASALRLSLLSDFWERRIFYGADLIFNDFLSRADPYWMQMAPTWEFSQKIGFEILRIFRIYLLAGFSPDGFDHYGFAFGVNMPGFFNGRDIEGLMQFVSVGDNEANHIMFYARVELGKRIRK